MTSGNLFAYLGPPLSEAPSSPEAPNAESTPYSEVMLSSQAPSLLLTMTSSLR